YEYVLGFKKNVDKAYQVPVDHRWARLEQEFADNIDEYLANDITLDECIGQTISIWKEILGQEATGTISRSITTGLEKETSGFGLLTLLVALPVTYYIKRKRQ
ncbi:MAG: hypothetical protein ACTSPV_16315, partial [Candidatus Hodarchaeales archaeon]